jgi:protein gp37
MNKTKIEWCDYTLNLITGCLNHTNGLCNGGGFPCYAYKLAHGRLKRKYLANLNYAPPIDITDYFFPGRHIEDKHWLADPFYPRLWPSRFTVKGISKGSRIFLNDMSDWVGIGIPEEWTRKVLDFIKANPDHTFLTLTKQPQNLPKFSPFPENCWVGATATNELFYSQALYHLIVVRASVKFISFEPLLSSINPMLLQNTLPAIDWLIIGAQTKPYKPPQIEWVQEIVKAADKADIPVFLKDNLIPLLQQNNHNIYSFPEWAGRQFAVTGDFSLAPCEPHLNEPMRKLRQEFPDGKP